MDYEYFSEKELRCKCGMCDSTGDEMSPEFMDKIDALRALIGKPMSVASAYRCPDHPREAAKRKPGTHTLGHAIDLRVKHDTAYELVRLAMAVGIKGVGVSQKGDPQYRFIHLDDTEENRPRIWSY